MLGLRTRSLSAAETPGPTFRRNGVARIVFGSVPAKLMMGSENGEAGCVNVPHTRFDSSYTLRDR